VLNGFKSFFDDRELVQLRDTLEAACGELNIDWSAEHAPVREHVASLIMRMAGNGERDPLTIQRRVVMRLSRQDFAA
jgi:hypothetical protein